MGARTTFAELATNMRRSCSLSLSLSCSPFISTPSSRCVCLLLMLNLFNFQLFYVGSVMLRRQSSSACNFAELALGCGFESPQSKTTRISTAHRREFTERRGKGLLNPSSVNSCKLEAITLEELQRKNTPLPHMCNTGWRVKYRTKCTGPKAGAHNRLDENRKEILS